MIDLKKCSVFASYLTSALVYLKSVHFLTKIKLFRESEFRLDVTRLGTMVRRVVESIGAIEDGRRKRLVET